ncbi:MAG TPA: lipase family protein [Pyrinomonadaceae bacterium]
MAYLPPGDIRSYLADSHYATGGEWRLVWGPVETTGNLMYVVQRNQDNLYAVVIRGTVLSFSLGTLVDLYEDLDVGTQVQWTYPYMTGALVANGTLHGLNVLTTMDSNNLSLLEYLASIPTGGWLFVTGHSLGGCLATVLAPWLQYQLSTINPQLSVVTNTFAAPSAGNQAFADWYTNQALRGRSWRYYNSIDIIPRLWSNVPGIKDLFPSPGKSCPFGMRGVIDLINGWLVDLDEVSYVQPNGAGNPLAGTATPAGWLTEAGHQHDHNYYLTLLGAPTVPLPGTSASRHVKTRRIIPRPGETAASVPTDGSAGQTTNQGAA